MFKPIATTALSLSVLTLAAGPALAQARTQAKPQPAPVVVQAQPKPASAVSQAQPALAVVAFTKPKLEFSLLGGYRWMAGSPINLGSTTTTTLDNKTDISNPATPPVTSTSSGTRTDASATSTTDMQTGFSVSGSATYWLDDSFGLGLDYTFANTASKLDLFHTLALGTANTQTLDTDPANGTNTASKAVTSSLTFNGNTVNVSNAPTIRGTPGNADYKEINTTKADVSGFNGLSWTIANGAQVGLGGGMSTFVNTDGAVIDTVTPATATNTFTATGKIGGTRESGTTMHMVDALTKTVIGANARGELHLLAGVSVPMFMTRNRTINTITGADGTGPAQQTVVYADTADATRNFTQVTSVEASEESDSSGSATMVGPMIGLGGTFKVSDAFRLYGKFGYTPVMAGTSVNTSTSTNYRKVSQDYTEAGINAGAGRVKGQTSTNEDRTTSTSGDSKTSFVGTTASTFVLGARFNLSETLGLVVEGVDQNVSGMGYTGFNAGVNLAF